MLFLRGLDPWRPVGGIADLDAVVELAQRLLGANKNRWEQSTTGNLGRGEETWVYGRGGRPCRRCGTRIRVSRPTGQSRDPQERITFWCPHCQPAAS